MGEHTAQTFVGMDVHQRSISLAILGPDGELFKDKIPPSAEAVRKVFERLGPGVRACYEAGPAGYGLQRQLAELGVDCIVVAPSLIPRRPGRRVKTDQRDARSLVGSCPERAQLRRAAQPGIDHQDRERASAPDPGRGGLDVSQQGRARLQVAAPLARPAPRRPQLRAGRPGSPPLAVLAPGAPRQADGDGHGGRGQGADGVRLGPDERAVHHSQHVRPRASGNG